MNRKYIIYTSAVFMTISSAFSQIASSAAEVCPLKVGMSIPETLLKDINGEEINLGTLLAEKPTVLIFYRGSWCPYCNMHLAQLQEAEEKIIEMGFQIIAISPDLPINLKEAADKNDLNYTLLSDSKLQFTQAMGLAFKMKESKVKIYKEKFDIDIEGASGETHHALPVPAAYLVDKKGLVHFSYVNPNYKTRIDPEILLVAATSLVTKTENLE